MNHTAQNNVEQVKAAAAGRELELFEYVAHIDREYLDGRHHPCPKCGGTDRFRCDRQKGFVICNQCFNSKNGDFLSAIQHFRDIDFRQALAESAYRLGITHSLDGTNGNGRPVDPLARMAETKRCPVESLKVCGGQPDAKRQSVEFPMYSIEAGDIARCSEFTCWPDGKDEKFRKGLNAKGKPAGMFLLHDQAGAPIRPAAGDDLLLLEGVKDQARAHSLGYLAVGLPGKSIKAEWVELFRGVNVLVCLDNDKAGAEASPKVAKALQGVAASVRIVTLPHPGDLRDNLAVDGGEQAVRDAITKASQAGHHAEPTYRTVEPGALVRADDRANFGHVLQDLGDRCLVRFVSPDTGATADVELPKSKLRLSDGSRLASGGGSQWTKAKSIGELVTVYPKLRTPIIHGLLRRGETCNIIAPPKRGKSWLAIMLAICIVLGRKFLDTYQCEPGKVLILDNELHGETSADRVPRVAEAMGVPFSEIREGLYVENFRGKLVDIFTLDGFLSQYEPGEVSAVVCDALYRFLPKGCDENSNTDMTAVYNQIDAYAMRMDCGFFAIHHASKGNQSGKAVTDVGAGAGSQARAVDCHLILRDHAETDCCVLEAAARSWAPIAPVVLRWQYPIWELATDLDPAALKSDRPTSQDKLETIKADILKALVHYPDGATKRSIQSYSGRPAAWERAIRELVDAGEIVACDVPSKVHKKPDDGWKRIYRNDD